MDDKFHEDTNSGQSEINGIPKSTIEELGRLMSSESFINASKLETKLRDLYEPTIVKYESIARMFSSPLWNNRELLTTTAALASLSTQLDKTQASVRTALEPVAKLGTGLTAFDTNAVAAATKPFRTNFSGVRDFTSATAAMTSLSTQIDKTQASVQAIIKPFSKMQAEISALGANTFSTAIKPFYTDLSGVLAEISKPFITANKFLSNTSIGSAISSYETHYAQNVYFPIQSFIRAIDFSPVYSILENLRGFDYSKYKHKLNDIVCQETYDARWFPHALCSDNIEMIRKFWNIIDTTKKSKNRIKRIDALVFSSYTKGRIEAKKKTWREKNIPEYKMRMIHQAVQAYHRKEYAITVVMLSTLWEGIIYDKANDARGKNGKRTKADFKKLMSQAEYSTVFSSFFDEYIMYDCRSNEEVKEDVPGRNSSAHSWYNKYPSRKAGLNAIIFTDFLLNLSPLEEESVNG